MFEAINHIDVDRKNSLPVSDFTNRYLGTSTPVIFGDLSHRWPAYRNWDIDYVKNVLTDKVINVFSNDIQLNGGDSRSPIMPLPADEYFELLNHGQNDLQIRELNVPRRTPELLEDFEFPRLGLRFLRRASRLSIGGNHSLENMHYRLDLAESFLCNFGGTQNVLLIRPEQAKYTYEPPTAFESILTVDYSEQGRTKNPAISKINAYYAELNHGDVLYIPSEYRYAVEYETKAIGLTLVASSLAMGKRIRALNNRMVVKPLDALALRALGARWKRRRLRKAVRRSKR